MSSWEVGAVGWDLGIQMFTSFKKYPFSDLKITVLQVKTVWFVIIIVILFKAALRISS